MDFLRDILINILSDAIWMLGGFLLALLLKKKHPGCDVDNNATTSAFKKNKGVRLKSLQVSDKDKEYIFVTLDALIRDFKNKQAYSK